MFQKRYSSDGRELKWYQSSMHSVMGSEEYHRQHDMNPHYYDSEWEHYQHRHGERLYIEPHVSYVGGVLQQFRRGFVIVAVILALLVFCGGFLIMGIMQQTVSQQIHPSPSDGKICGYATTHDGTKVALKSQTDTTFSLRGDVNSQTNCGY